MSVRVSPRPIMFLPAWVTHPPVGWAVIPARCTRRRSTSMKNKTSSQNSTQLGVNLVFKWDDFGHADVAPAIPTE
jgi:hypothetical protein